MTKSATWSLVGAALIVGLAAGRSFVPAGADPRPKFDPDPWARDTLAVLGRVNLSDGVDLYVVHVPADPMGSSCVVLVAPGASSLRCDTDLLTRPPVESLPSD